MIVPMQYEKDELAISTDPSRLDLDAMHAYLSQAYWCAGIPKETLARAVENSLCFGIYRGAQQIGFARVITDRATYAYLADVYVLEGYRNRGVATWLMECIMRHPHLHGLRRFSLVTRDAHELYKKFGFSQLRHPEQYMEIHKSEIYGKRI